MAYELKPGQGSLFINKEKGKGTHPDRQGDALVHCPRCSANFAVRIAGWLRESATGLKFLSLNITSKEDPGAAPKPAAPAAARPAPATDDFAQDDIPF